MTFLCSFYTYRHHHHHQSIQHNFHVCPILAHRLRRIPKMLSILMSTHELAQPLHKQGIHTIATKLQQQAKQNQILHTPISIPPRQKTKTYHKQFDTNVPFPLWCPWDVVCWSLGVMRSRQSGSRSVESSCSDALDSGTES